jgi:hypothetical protein
VIGVGVKKSTSDLLISNCDEFIFYDDLVRGNDQQRKAKAKPDAEKKVTPKKPVDEDKKTDDEKKQEALDLVMATIDDLFAERGEEEKVWGSMVKQTLKRRNPGFNESYHGFRTFGKLLEEAQNRKLLGLEYDEKSGGYIVSTVNRDD